jgi:hypothetical protein
MGIMAISHAGHNHPSTPADPSACRKLMKGAGGSPTVQRIESDGSYIGDHIRKTAAAAKIKATMDRRYDEAEIKMTGATARKLARHAAAADRARIQPRRSGARVALTNSSCVQAALHTGTGRCACGWHTENHCYDACTSHAA